MLSFVIVLLMLLRGTVGQVASATESSRLKVFMNWPEGGLSAWLVEAVPNIKTLPTKKEEKNYEVVYIFVIFI